MYQRCLRAWDRFAIDYAILGEVHQAFNLGPVLRGGFPNSADIHIHGVNKQASPEGMIGRQGDMFAGGRLVRRRGEAAGL